MKCFVPLLFAVVLTSGSQGWAETVIPNSTAVNPQVMESDREFLESETNGAAALTERVPAPLATPPEPVAERKPAKTARAVATTDSAPKAKPPVKAKSAPKVKATTKVRTLPPAAPVVVVPEPVVRDDRFFDDDDDELFEDDEETRRVVTPRVKERGRYTDDEIAPAQEIRRKGSQARRFIQRLLPF
jgi:hypothetical protein